MEVTLLRQITLWVGRDDSNKCKTATKTKRPDRMNAPLISSGRLIKMSLVAERQSNEVPLLPSPMLRNSAHYSEIGSGVCDLILISSWKIDFNVALQKSRSIKGFSVAHQCYQLKGVIR